MCKQIFVHIYILQTLVQKLGRGIETVLSLMQKPNTFINNQWQDEQSTLLLSECVFVYSFNWHLNPSAGLLKRLSSKRENEID